MWRSRRFGFLNIWAADEPVHGGDRPAADTQRGRRRLRHGLEARRQPGRCRRRRGQQGFTLVELLVVLVIIILLASLVGPRAVSYLSSSKTKIAKAQIEGFATALQLYRVDVGRYPTSSEGLKALVEKPSGAENWNGPYLGKNAVPLDPWQNAYEYSAPGQNRDFEIMSLGADKQKGGEGENADVKSWQ